MKSVGKKKLVKANLGHNFDDERFSRPISFGSKNVEESPRPHDLWLEWSGVERKVPILE